MKIFHTSDWHLGKIIHGKSMLEDQKYFIENNFFPAVFNHKPDVVIIAGDIYDRSVAPVEAVSLFSNVIERLHKENIKVFCISGNHDSAERITAYSEILNSSGIYFRSNISDCFEPITMRDDINNTNINFYLLPYFDLVKAKIALKTYDNSENDINSLDEAYSKIIEKIYENLNKNEINILIAHCFVSGSKISDIENPLLVGNSCEVGFAKFSKFDYVALGHIHSQQNCAVNMRYSGAPLKYSFGEPDKDKFITIVEFNGKEEKSISQLKIDALHKMQTIEGRFNDLIDKGRSETNKNYLRVELSDEEPIFMPIYRLREFYPNILELSSDYVKPDISKNNSNFNSLNNELEVFKSFMNDICNMEVNDNDCKFFNEALKQAYKEN